MATEKTARATWEGTLAEGSGRFSLGSGAVTDQAVSWRDRAEEGGGTSPEELIAAAHASCVLMALAGGLARAGTPRRSSSRKPRRRSTRSARASR